MEAFTSRGRGRTSLIVLAALSRVISAHVSVRWLDQFALVKAFDT
jgi:hypothetical protein